MRRASWRVHGAAARPDAPDGRCVRLTTGSGAAASNCLPSKETAPPSLRGGAALCGRRNIGAAHTMASYPHRSPGRCRPADADASNATWSRGGSL
jgi:hypothetical protein